MEERSTLRQLIRASMVGIHLVTTTFVGLAIGFFLDKYLGTKPWLTIVCFILGVATGFRDLFRMISRESSGDETDSSGQSDTGPSKKDSLDDGGRDG